MERINKLEGTLNKAVDAIDKLTKRTIELKKQVMTKISMAETVRLNFGIFPLS